MTKFLLVYLRIYGACARATGKSLARAPWTLLLPMGLSLAFGLVAGVLVAALGGLIGGLLLGLVVAAAGSCYLYFLDGLVAQTKVSLSDFAESLRAYFWSVMNLLFVFWVGSLVERLLPANLVYVLWLAVVVLCNAAPEVIYLRGTYGGLQTLQRSLEFLQENWLEWAPPNVLLLGGLYVALGQLPWMVGSIGAYLVFGALLHIGMVYRGHLFEALDGTSHRQRMFKHRMGI